MYRAVVSRLDPLNTLCLLLNIGAGSWQPTVRGHKLIVRQTAAKFDIRV